MTNPQRSVTVHVEQLGDELCIYDWQRKEVHALNPTAAQIWQLCDGQTSPEQIAQILQAELNLPNAEELVWFSLSQIEKAHLLAEPVVKPARHRVLPRRTFLQLGIAAALLPVIHSIVAPTPVAAASPTPTSLIGPIGPIPTTTPTPSPVPTPTTTPTPSLVPTPTSGTGPIGPTPTIRPTATNPTA